MRRDLHCLAYAARIPMEGVCLRCTRMYSSTRMYMNTSPVCIMILMQTDMHLTMTALLSLAMITANHHLLM